MNEAMREVLLQQGWEPREILSMEALAEGLPSSDDSGLVRLMGGDPRVAIRFLRLFLEQKTGEPWTYLTWDPTPEHPAKRSEFVRDRDLHPNGG